MAIGTSVTPSSLKEKTDMNVRLHITIPGGGNFFLVSEPLHGKVSTVSDSPTNIVAYIPDTGFIGEDIFFYKLTDRQEADSSIAKVIVTVRSTQVPRTAHLLWILVSISLLVAIYYAYLDTTSKRQTWICYCLGRM